MYKSITKITSGMLDGLQNWDYHHIELWNYDDVIKWKHFPRNWPFVRGIHRSRWIPHTKGQWRGALMISLICVWINGWVNNREAGDSRRHRGHYDVNVMYHAHWWHIGHKNTSSSKTTAFISYLVTHWGPAKMTDDIISIFILMNKDIGISIKISLRGPKLQWAGIISDNGFASNSEILKSSHWSCCRHIFFYQTSNPICRDI